MMPSSYHIHTLCLKDESAFCQNGCISDDAWEAKSHHTRPWDKSYLLSAGISADHRSTVGRIELIILAWCHRFILAVNNSGIASHKCRSNYSLAIRGNLGMS